MRTQSSLSCPSCAYPSLPSRCCPMMTKGVWPALRAWAWLLWLLWLDKWLRPLRFNLGNRLSWSFAALLPFSPAPALAPAPALPLDKALRANRCLIETFPLVCYCCCSPTGFRDFRNGLEASEDLQLNFQFQFLYLCSCCRPLPPRRPIPPFAA